jgi:hypothetical protein
MSAVAALLVSCSDPGADSAGRTTSVGTTAQPTANAQLTTKAQRGKVRIDASGRPVACTVA